MRLRGARAISSVAFVGVLVVGCRGVIGIEDLGLDAGGSSTTDSGGKSDGGGVSDGAIVDTGILADVKLDSPTDDCASMPGMMCHACCRGAYMAQQHELDNLAVTAGCICGGAACTTECATSICMPSSMTAPPGSCASCVDGQFPMMPAMKCNDALDMCALSPTCKAAATCARSCPP